MILTKTKQGIHQVITYRVPTLLVKKNPGLFQDFPGHFSRTFQDPTNIFPGPYHTPVYYAVEMCGE